MKQTSIGRQIGEHLMHIVLTVPKAGATREDNAREVLKALMPYFKKPSSHSLTSMYVDALFKLRAAVRHYGQNNIHIRGQMRGENCPARFRLTDDQWTNFGKLRYFGLAVHADPDHPRSGKWLLTSRGAAFLRGEIPVPKKVVAFGGHPVKTEPEASLMVRIEDYRHLPSYESYQDFKPAASKPVNQQTLA